MKRVTALLLSIVICFLLCGCCLKHEWTEATCTEPKTCVKCGETEGEALGHLWVDATYKEPKTCSRCGMTEGDPLEAQYFDMSFSQFIKDFNSEYASGGFTLEKVESRGFIAHFRGIEFIVFNQDTTAGNNGGASAYSTTEHEHFNRLLVRFVDKSTNQLDSDARVIVVETGMLFAQILDSYFTPDDYLNNLSQINGELVSTVNDITYTLHTYNSSVGSILQYTYDFEITI